MEFREYPDYIRLPSAYLLFVPLTIVGQPLVVLIGGSALDPSPAGLAIVALLLVSLARRSSLAWALLLAWNSMMLLLVAGLGAWSAAGLLAIVLHASSIALLVTPSMRRHVDRARGLGGQVSAG